MSEQRWTEDMDRALFALRWQERSFGDIAGALGVSRNSAMSRWRRKFATWEETAAESPVRPTPLVGRRVRPVVEARHPDSTDTSCPRFARHDKHIAAVMGEGGFPVLRRAA